MTGMFKIQKGVPIPAPHRSNKGMRKKYPIEDMVAGDMFFVPERPSKLVAAYISKITKNIDGTFTTRNCFAVLKGDEWVIAAEDTPGAVEGTAIWRVT